MKDIRGYELKKRDLDYWFTLYDKWTNQALRASRQKKVWEQYDSLFGTTYTSVAMLDEQAEMVAKEIVRLRQKQKEEWEAKK